MWTDVSITSALALGVAVYALRARSYAASVLLAVLEARLGLLAHEAAHRGHGAQVVYDYAMGSHAQWKRKHHAGHHAHTNDTSRDPDVALAPLMRVSPSQPWYPFHRHQWWYQWLLYPLVPLMLRLNGWIDLYRVASSREIAVHHARALPACILHIVWPFATYGWTGWTHYALTCAILGWIYGALFSVNHVNELVEWDAPITDDRVTRQLKTTADWCPGGAWSNWATVGLNHQAVHHVYPTRPSKEYCTLQQEIAVHPSYRAFATLWDALSSNTRHLKRLGASPERSYQE